MEEMGHYYKRLIMPLGLYQQQLTAWQQARWVYEAALVDSSYPRTSLHRVTKCFTAHETPGPTAEHRGLSLSLLIAMHAGCV